jgi:hypothetical protein
MKDGDTQRLVDTLAEVTRNGLGQMRPEQLDDGWLRMESVLSAGRYPSVPIVAIPRRRWLGGLAFAAATLAVGFAAYRLVPPRAGAPLHYALEGAALGPGETVQASPTAPAKLVFSDTSQISISPKSKLSVLSLDEHGSRVSLADGELDVQVQHRPGTSWRFDAGPFTVWVRGTEFHIAYEAALGRLALQMLTGVVEVRGPAQDRVLSLHAGESMELFAGNAPRLVTAREAPSTVLEPKPAEVAPVVSEPASSRFPSHLQRRKASLPEHAESAIGSTAWASLIAQGDFMAVVKDAERRGIDVTLASASAANLTSLADAARYMKRNDLAHQTLVALRARFPGTTRAGDAAFFLGRLAELTPSASGVAVGWYETYLRESVRGPYGDDALGREIALLARTDRGRARLAAQVYLQRFPSGTHAELAKSLLESVP